MDEPAQNPSAPHGTIVMADDKPKQEGGTIAFPESPPVFPEAPAPVPETGQETFVVPSVSEMEKSAPAQPNPAPNPFIPKGVVPLDQASQVQSPGMPASGGFMKKMIIVLIFLLLLGGFAGGGWFLYQRIRGKTGGTLTYWGLWEDAAVIQGVISEFEAKNPNIKIQYIKNSHKQYRERLQSAIARGEGPDVFRFHNTWVPMLRSELAIAPEGFMTAAEFSSTFYPVTSADLVAGQSIFGVPMMIDGLGLYYNEEMFAKAGVSPPTTWEEMLSVVPNLTVKSDDGKIVTSAIALGTTGNTEHFSDILATMMMQNGVKLTNPTGKPAEEALIFYRKFSDPSDPIYTWNETLDNSIYAFATGRVAMIFAPSWRVFEIVQISKDNGKELRFKIAPIPQLPGNTVTWASYWVEGVSAKSKYPKAAWEFIKFLTSKDTVTKLYTEEGKSRLFGEPYARTELADSLKNDPYTGAFVIQAPQAKSFPLASRTFDNGLNDRMIKYFEDAVNGFLKGTAPSAVLSTAASGFSQVLSSFGLSSASAPAGK